jgi:hypothetical protein
VKILELLNQALGWPLEERPSPSSVASWVQKSGYYVYEDTSGKDFSEGYAAIADESMMVGSEKLLLTLGVSSEKGASGSLTGGDVRVLSMRVASSWSSARIGSVFGEVEEKLGSAPAYVISDNASTISKAVRDRGYPHVRDVGHSVGLLVQQVYGREQDFLQLLKEVSAVKFREVMRSTAHLLPPRQRAIARFMNLSGTVAWGAAMLRAFGRMSAPEQQAFGFLRRHQGVISELHAVFSAVNPVLQQLKREGLCAASAQRSLSAVAPLAASPLPRVSALGRLIAEYIEAEYGRLSAQHKCWHISSDIIESLFGSYKARKSPNALYGVTKQIFSLPLLTHLKGANAPASGCFKRYLEQVSLRDLTAWKERHLAESRMIKRKELLCA